MKKYKKYIIYVVITLVFSFLGAALVCSIAKKNFGSTADWVSGIGSLIAIGFAYWQIAEQRKEYEEDKKDQKILNQLNKRPFFIVSIKKVLFSKDDLFFLSPEQGDKPEKHFYYNDDRHRCSLINDEFFYCIKNVENCVALNPTLVITYKYANSEPKEFIHAETLVQSREEVKFLTNIVIDKNKINPARAEKKIELYFGSTDERYYKQTFEERKTQIISKNEIGDDSIFVSKKIKEIKKSSIPQSPAAIIEKPGEDIFAHKKNQDIPISDSEINIYINM
ncbi:hypothetical protein [Lactobacillus melliventris]|uniref:Uncharacterized protein n=1 Tax=Lactobacillus melliventris TaxID=1218507 RepID=A0ABX5N134_9LACO|nr:hypothetical protein [Lactobacillus melliventris]PXY84357.1 hypothetical protein DK873_04170 [Lactobacillus melliventris]